MSQASQAMSNATKSQSAATRTCIKTGGTSSGPMDAIDDENMLAIEHTFPNLQRAMTSTSVENLELYTQVGINIVNDIIQRLDPAKHTRDVFHWMTSLGDLMHQAQTPEYILGVIGATGHGKSSLINALLGEAQLVPTNCVRACTAVITEISWNPSDKPEERYIGHIQFISMDEWRFELDQLFSDLILSNGELTGDANNKATDAGVAWAKIKAIYPHITRETLTKTNAETLADDPAVSSLLGATKTIYSATAKAFYKDIRVYVDSKEKLSTEEKGHMAYDHDELSPDNDVDTGELEFDSEYLERGPAVKERKMELWPLIKVVKIQTKADILSTGVVIVDLPGIEDSNAARAAIAGKYIEKCHGVWIVASIQRAVDDKSAQNLLSRSFKQQLQLDGKLSNISFICSKTDDICVREASESLGLQDEYARVDKRLMALQKWEESNQEQLDYEERHCATLCGFLGEIDRRLSEWERLESDQKRGKSVRVSQINFRKRKTSSRSTRAYKRQKAESSKVEEDANKYPSIDDLLDQLKKDGPPLIEDQPLSGEQIHSMIEYLRSRKSAVFEEKEALEDQIEDKANKLAELSEALGQAQTNLEILCVRRRNDYARGAMRKNYALEVKEVDQDLSQQTDPDMFDPEEELRDYDDLADKLPVFCVSSRAYQSLCGIIQPRIETPGFEDAEATEVPQLISHAKKLTEIRRAHACVQFLNDFLQNMNSLHLWVMQDDNEIHLTDMEKQAQVDNVKSALVTLENDLRKAVSEFIQECHQILTKNLFKRLRSSVAIAIKRAPGIAYKWPSRQRGDGGLPYISYKATCGRMGVFSGKLGPRDFNEDLIYPLKARLANTWEQSFTKKIPKALKRFTNVSEELFRSFHATIKTQFQHKSTFTSINVLETQLQARAASLTHMARTFNSDVTKLQREANRGFHPAIMEAMSRTYQDCAKEHGRGCFERMKAIMDRDLSTNGQLIFNAAADPVKRDLTFLCNYLKSTLETRTARILDDMTTDYSNVIVGRDVTKESKTVRGEVALLLEGLDDLFEHSLRANAESSLPEPAVDGKMLIIKTEPE